MLGPTTETVGHNGRTHDTRRLVRELEAIFHELEAHEERNELIREIDSAILRLTFSPQEVLDLIVRKCLAKTDASHGQIVRYRRNQLFVDASTELARVGEALPLEASLCGMALRDEEDKHYGDVRQIPPDAYVRYHEETQSELALLIRSSSGNRILGVLDLERDKPGRFADDGVAFAHLLAGQAAIAIEHARTWTAIRTLYELGTKLLSGSLTMEESDQQILDAILEGFDVEHGQIFRLAREELVIVASSRKEDLGLRPDRENSVCGRHLLVEQRRDNLIIQDIETSEYAEFYLGLLQPRAGRMRSELVVPLIDVDLVGALNIESPQRGAFTELDSRLFGLLGPLLARAVGATAMRTSQEHRDRVLSANLAMTSLGHVAQSFLHKFGGDIGDARGKIIELRKHLRAHDLPALSQRSMSVDVFIEDIVGTLSRARSEIEGFSARFNPDRPQFKPREIDLVELGRTVVANVASTAMDITFEALLPEQLGRGPTVRSRATCILTDQAREVVENLVSNAIWAVQQRGAAHRGSVRVTVDLPNPLRARLTVEDNGVGIAEEDRPRIFSYGFTTKAASGRSQGLGLSLCKLYVLQRGGELTFDSQVDVGTKFYLEFPVAP